MGDRALIQFVATNRNGDINDVSPVVYLHWNGTEVDKWLQLWWKNMEGRHGDVSYGVARFIGICHTLIDGNLSLGVWNQSDVLAQEDSHGDAGCFVVDCDNGNVTAMGGYGESFNLIERHNLIEKYMAEKVTD